MKPILGIVPYNKVLMTVVAAATVDYSAIEEISSLKISIENLYYVDQIRPLFNLIASMFLTLPAVFLVFFVFFKNDKPFRRLCSTAIFCMFLNIICWFHVENFTFIYVTQLLMDNDLRIQNEFNDTCLKNLSLVMYFAFSFLRLTVIFFPNWAYDNLIFKVFK